MKASLVKTYKYLGVRAAECYLTDLSVRFSQPKAFNDPFEMQPEFWITNSDVNAREEFSCNFVLSGHKTNYEKYLIHGQQPASPPHKINNSKLIDEFNKKIGILCLTQDNKLLPANILMWAHYCESHRGIVIEFKKNHTFLASATSVHYIERRPIIDAKFLSENNRIAIGDLYFKSDDWAYEKELRITKRLDDCRRLDGAENPPGNPIYTSKIPETAVSCIYLGCNASSETKQKAIAFHQKTGIKVIFLRVHGEEFKLIPYTFLGGEYSEMMQLQEKLLFCREEI